MEFSTTKRSWFWVIGLYHIIGGIIGFLVFADIIDINIRQNYLQLLFSSTLIISGLLLLFEIKSSAIINKALLLIQIPIFVGYQLTYGMFCIWGLFLTYGPQWFLSIFGTGIEISQKKGPDSFFIIGISIIPLLLFIFFHRFSRVLKKRSLYQNHTIGNLPNESDITQRKESLYN